MARYATIDNGYASTLTRSLGGVLWRSPRSKQCWWWPRSCTSGGSQRLHVSQPMIEQADAGLEREIGGQLFERTSRRVRLTPLGATLLEGRHPAIRRSPRPCAEPATRPPTEGSITVGFTTTTEGPLITRWSRRTAKPTPCSEVRLHQVPMIDPYALSRPVKSTSSSTGWPEASPTLFSARRSTARSGARRRRRPSARHAREVPAPGRPGRPACLCYTPRFPRSLMDATSPPTHPVRPDDSAHPPVNDMAEMWSLVALGQIVHSHYCLHRTITREDISLVAIVDMAAVSLGLIWCSSHENARIRALAQYCPLHPGSGARRRLKNLDRHQLETTTAPRLTGSHENSPSCGAAHSRSRSRLRSSPVGHRFTTVRYRALPSPLRGLLRR